MKPDKKTWLMKRIAILKGFLDCRYNSCSLLFTALPAANADIMTSIYLAYVII